MQRGFRLTALFYRNTWKVWSRSAQYIRKPSRRENFLGYFGPLSLIVLLGLWLIGLISGFALVQYGLGAHLQTNINVAEMIVDDGIIALTQRRGTLQLFAGLVDLSTPK